PSNTCTRRRWPSITWKWTRTVSPALNWGTDRSWRRSSCSMTLLMGGGPRNGRGGMVAECRAGALVERDPLRRPVRRDDLAEEVLGRARAPGPRVAGALAVVPEHDVPPGWDLLRLDDVVAAPR